MKKKLLLSLICGILLSSAAQAAISVPLTIQEALYPGDLTGHTYTSPGGIQRSNAPWCTGVPIADAAGLRSASTLALTSSTAGQFRITETWPDGNAKWVEACGIIPNVTAGGTATDTLVDSGSGNFGGANLASGTNPIIVNTTGGTCGSGSAICFYIKSTNHNGIDQVTIGSTTVVGSGSSDGFVVTGPASPATSCTAGGCTTQYKSANSPSSTCAVDGVQNGPVTAVIKCMGDLADGSGNVYMHYTVRYYFYTGKSFVRVVSSLRNADNGASNSFASAFKGLQGWEFRTGINVSNPSYSISTATAGAPQTGSLTGSDSVYLYQGQTSFLQDNSWSACNNPCTDWTTDSGWTIKKNGGGLASGTGSQPPEGWADLDSAGVGINMGTLLFAANGPKSLKFTSGGKVATVGLFALENSTPVYMPWPQYRTDEFYLTFHAVSLPSPKNNFLSLQHPLIARAPYTQYNSAGVFFYPLENPTEEDAYYHSVVTSASPAIRTANGCAAYGTLGCIQDVGTQDTMNWPLFFYPGGYTYDEGGGRDQIEWRYSYLVNWLTRGHTGRYLQVKVFEMMQADMAYPRSDGFVWHTQPATSINGFGQPTVTSANYNVNLRYWPDQEHIHTWGILDYYAMSGDETVHDSIMNGMRDWFLSSNTYQAGADGGPLNGKVNVSGTAVTLAAGSNFAAYMAGQPITIGGTVYNVATVNSSSSLTLTSSAGTQSGVTWTILGGVGNTRSVGLQLSNSARMSVFLAATGDPADAAAALQQGEKDYLVQVKPSLCESSTPAGCSFGPANSGPWTIEGTSYTRGNDVQAYSYVGIPYCGAGNYRTEGIFQTSILDQGLWEIRTVAGPGWSEYVTAFDIAAGKVQWAMTEGANYDGTAAWTNNGFRYYILFDVPNGACGDTTYYPVRANQTVWFPFYLANQYWGATYSPSMTNWQPFLNQTIQHMMSPLSAGVGLTAESIDIGGYQLGALIYALNHGSTNTLQTVPISNFTSNGGGSYTLSWTVPSNAQSYRIKWGTKNIVDWIGFDPVNNVFKGDPVNTMNWFAATEVPSVPAPATAGTVQSVTISTGTTGLTAANFAVKAFEGGTVQTQPPPPPTATSLVQVGGSGQTGTVGTALASPFIVEVTDQSSNPVSGIGVTFSVTAGSGTLSTTQATTNSQGLASATLTLGPAAGVNTVHATSGALAGSPVTFSATSTATAPTAANLVLISGNGQTGTAGQVLGNALTVEATSSSGAAVSGVTVTFAVTSGGGSLSATQVTTNSQGQASSTLTLGSAGANTVSATSGTLAGSPISFAETAQAASTGSTSLTWVKATPNATEWPTANGFMSMNWDPVSRKTIIFGHRGFAGTVSVTKGSPTITWISGDKFGDYWQKGDRISIGSITYNILAPPTIPATPPLTNNKTQLTLTTNYTGNTGTASYTAAETPIYSNDVIFYDAGTNTWTWGPGTGAQVDLCIVDTPTMPGQRHPIGQMAIDTKRGYLWLMSGVNQSCTISPVVTNGTTTVTNSTSGFTMGTNWNGVTACIGTGAANCVNYTVDHVVDVDTVVMTAPVPAGQTFFRLFPPENNNTMQPNSKYDTYYLTLNADPTTDTWTQVTTANHVPNANAESAMRYDPDDDVIIMFGYDQSADTHDTFVYCSTIGNPGGTLTASQTAAGCARANDWTEVTTTCVGSHCIRNHPPGSNFPSLVWDTATHNLLQYGGTQGYLGTAQNVVFSYNVPSHTWTQKTSVNVPPAVIWNNNCCLQSAPTIAYNSATQKLFYHHLNNGTSADYVYDPVADTWTMLASPSAGTGATATNGASGQMATYDAANNMIIGWNEGGASDLWRGSFGGAPAQNPCDLNGDGAVNILDVQGAINQVLGISACGNANLTGGATCTVVDVQRVINAALGGACVTGP